MRGNTKAVKMTNFEFFEYAQHSNFLSYSHFEYVYPIWTKYQSKNRGVKIILIFSIHANVWYPGEDVLKKEKLLFVAHKKWQWMHHSSYLVQCCEILKYTVDIHVLAMSARGK